MNAFRGLDSHLKTRSAEPPDLAALTGVRSGKRTYYSAYQRSNERLERAVLAMDSLSRAVVHAGEGPRGVITEVVHAAAEHLAARWVVIALRDGQLPDVRPRLLARDPQGVIYDDQTRVPPEVSEEFIKLRAEVGVATSDADWVRVPMRLDGTVVGGLAVMPGLAEPPDGADASVLAVLVNLAAACLHISELYRLGISEQRRAQQLFDEIAEQSRILASRTEELRAAEQRLRVADQRALLENERRRIALELHDSVAQTVLTAGLAVQVLKQEVRLLAGAEHLADDLEQARHLMATATEQLRSVIYALHHERIAEDVASLPELLNEMAAQHQPRLRVTVRVEGRPVPLGTASEHALARTAGESLFNVAMHSHASRALVRLRYLPHAVVLRVSDDGQGDPGEIRRRLRLARSGSADGRHRGLVSMALRAEGLGGALTIRRSRLGGIAVEATIPFRACGTTPTT